MDLYIVVTMKGVTYQFSGCGSADFKKPVLRAYGEMGHRFYFQESKNVKKKDDRFVAQHIAQFAFQESIPQASLTMVRIDKVATKKVKNASNMQQLRFDIIPF